jgi:hypothetical protein
MSRTIRSVDEQRRILWRTSWGVVLAVSGAFSLGYGASRSAHPSVGALRPPAWPLVLSLLVVACSIWFILAPRLNRWPFAPSPTDGDEDEAAEGWLAELTDADEEDQPAR